MTIHYIHFACTINEVTAAHFRNVFLQAVAAKAQRIHLLLNTEGGSNHHAFGMFSTIRSTTIPVITHNIGNVQSMGVIVFLAAPKRIMDPTARVLIHAMHWGFGAGQVDAARLAEYAERLEDDRKRYVELFKERTVGAESPLEIEQLLLGGHRILNADAAATAGISTEPAKAAVFETNAIHWWVLP